METKTIHKDGKLAAILSHFSILGLIIAYCINQEKKDEFGKFYMKQNLGLNCLFFLLGALISFINSPYSIYGFYLFNIVLWGYSFIGALSNECRVVPLIGNTIQKIFKSKK